MITNLKFLKDEHIKDMTIEDLKMTLTEEDLSGRKSKIITHYDLIPKLENMLLEKGYTLGKNEIIVAKKGLRRLPKLDPTDEYVLDSILVKNLVSSFNISSLENEEMNMRIGLSYNDRGVALAFGTNIKVCSNMTIIGAKNMIYSYGPNKVPFDKFMELAQKNINELDETFKFYNETIMSLKGKLATKDDLFNIIGKLEHLAVQNAYVDTKIAAPLNIGETSSFTKELIKANAFGNEINTLWDVFNVGTAVLTHSELNVHNKWQSLAAFGNFMVDNIANADNVSETPIIELS